MSRSYKQKISRFGNVMYERLDANRRKTGWEHCTLEYLLQRLHEELFELTQQVYLRDARDNRASDIQHEAADVANFAMMIAENAED